MAEALNWEREGRDWPHRRSSRFVRVDGESIHVQIMVPEGTPRAAAIPSVLLVHGTGASTHSWRGLMPMLAKRFRVVAPDLPGHGFSSLPAAGGYSLQGMAARLSALMQSLAVSPQLVVGHSAGAAVLARMCIDRMISPQHVVSVNGALLPLRGFPGEVFSPIAKLLSRSSLVPRLFAWRAGRPEVLERLLNGTGSKIDQQGQQLYRTLIGNPVHASAALEMMANWDLRQLERDLPNISSVSSLTLVCGENDRTVPPHEVDRVQALVPAASVIRLFGLGHLAHEEQPGAVNDLIDKLPITTGHQP